MSLASDILRRLGAPFDPRSEREVREDIEAELAFHLEQRERDLVAKGMTPEAAHDEARRRFGDVARIRAECRRAQIGGALMLQKSTLVLLGVLIAVIAWLSLQSIAAQRASRSEIDALQAELAQLTKAIQGKEPKTDAPVRGVEDARRDLENRIGRYIDNQKTVQQTTAEESTSIETWAARFEERAVTGTGNEVLANGLLNCSEPRRLTVLRAIWPKVNTAQRLTLLNVLGNALAERTARLVVHWCATDDRDATLQARAFELLWELAFVRFDADHYDEYLAWYEANKDLSLGEILDKSTPAMVQQLSIHGSWHEQMASCSQLRPHKQLTANPEYGRHLREAGGASLVQRWANWEEPEARLAALRWLGVLELDEVTARVILTPLLASTAPRAPEFVPEACRVLVELEATWGWEPLLEELRNAMIADRDHPAHIDAISAALGRFEGERVVPTILSWIVFANSPAANEALGKSALVELTGVEFDPSHDATWWKNWWLIHRDAYPADARTALGLPPIPEVTEKK